MKTYSKPSFILQEIIEGQDIVTASNVPATGEIIDVVDDD